MDKKNIRIHPVEHLFQQIHVTLASSCWDSVLDGQMASAVMRQKTNLKKKLLKAGKENRLGREADI